MPNYWLSTSPLSSSLAVHELEPAQERASRAGGFTATATLFCPWANRDAVIEDLLVNLVPYPRFPDSGAKARAASATFFGATVSDGGLMVPQYAKIVVEYQQGEDVEEGEGGAIYSEQLEPTAEFLTVSPKYLRWGSATGDKLTPEEAPGKRILGLDYVQTRYNLSTIPIGILEPNVVNDNPVTATLLGLTFPTDSLLYVNSLPSRTISADGTEGWTMPSRFSIRYTGWNKFWRAKTADWDYMYHSSDSGETGIYYNFPQVDIDALGILV